MRGNQSERWTAMRMEFIAAPFYHTSPTTCENNRHTVQVIVIMSKCGVLFRLCSVGGDSCVRLWEQDSGTMLCQDHLSDAGPLTCLVSPQEGM